MKTHLPPEAAIRSTSSSSRKRLALICATQCTWALAAMMSRSSDLVRLTLMAKLSSMKKTAIWPPSLFGAGFQQKQFVDDAFVGAKADGVAKKSGDRAEFATVGTAASGLHGNDAECSPAVADAVAACAVSDFGNQIELVEIDFVPGDCGIFLQRRLCVPGRNRRPEHRYL